jgi:hypothetical protein
LKALEGENSTKLDFSVRPKIIEDGNEQKVLFLEEKISFKQFRPKQSNPSAGAICGIIFQDIMQQTDCDS